MSRTTASPPQSAIDRLLLWLLPLLLFLTGSAIGYALLGKLPRLEWMPTLLPPLRLGLALLAGGLLAVLGFALLRPTPATATVLPASTPVPAAHAEPLPAAVRVVSPSAGQSPPARPLPVLKRESIKATPVTAPTADTTKTPALPPIALPPEYDKKGSALAQQRFQMLEDIARELEGDVVFPTCFDLIIRLRETLRKPDFSLGEVSTIIALDPLVSSKVLRQANSAAYGGSKVVDLRGAVTRLGVNAVRSIVMGIAMQQFILSRNLVAFNKITRNLWEHSVRSACAARVIARRLTAINPEDAQLAGLVHDLGAFYMIYRAAQYEELRIRPDTVKYLVFEWHESIGQTLLGALGMPEQIVEAVGDHDQPRPLPAKPGSLGDIVHIANRIAGGGRAGILGLTDEDENEPEIGEPYAGLLPEIEEATQEMLQTL